MGITGHVPQTWVDHIHEQTISFGVVFDAMNPPVGCDLYTGAYWHCDIHSVMHSGSAVNGMHPHAIHRTNTTLCWATLWGRGIVGAKDEGIRFQLDRRHIQGDR